MASVVVSYPAVEGATFNQDYYRLQHLPLVESAWTEFGLQSIEALFPVDNSQPFLGMAILRFADQAAIDAALASPATARVMGDISEFASVSPIIFRTDG